MLKMDGRRPMSDVMGTNGSGSVRPQSGPHHAALDETAGELSPELALIDDALAVSARTLLPEPEDTIDRLLRSVTTSRSETSLAPKAASAPSSAADQPAPRSGRIWRRILIAATVLGVAALALGFGVRVDFGGGDGAGAVGVSPPVSPAVVTVPGSDGAAEGNASQKAGDARPPKRGEVKKGTEVKRKAKPGSTTTAKTRANRPSADRVAGASRGAVPRRFAWAPVPRATGYYVEFFRGDTRVYAASTKSPEVTLPTRWRFRGRLQTLTSGDYRWYVWPVFEDGDRAPAATVQARLHVADSPA
jgi:hypothetical protein